MSSPSGALTLPLVSPEIVGIDWPLSGPQFGVNAGPMPVRQRDRQGWVVIMSSQQSDELQISIAAFARLHAGLRTHNQRNLQVFEEQYASLEAMLCTALECLRSAYGNTLNQIVLVSDELVGGVSLDDLSYYGSAIYIVFRGDKLSNDLFDNIIDTIFADLDASMLRLQVYLLTEEEWQEVQRKAELVGALETRALTLLSRR